MIATQSWVVQGLVACGFTDSEIRCGTEIHPPIYLLQRAGYKGGSRAYHFEWERFGPWSEDLGREYNEMSTPDLASIKECPPEELLVVAERINPLLNPPARSLLDRHTWLMLVASVEFLVTQSKQFSDNHSDRVSLIANRFSAEQVQMAKLALENARLL